MEHNPTNYWTITQKVYYLLQVEKLIQEIGNSNERRVRFNQLKADLDVSDFALGNLPILDTTPNRSTKEFFMHSSESDKAFVLVTYILVLMADHHFTSDQYLATVAMFTNIFGVDIPDTLRKINLILDDNPSIESEFRSKLIREKSSSKKAPEQIITRNTIVYLVIMTLAIIGLISIFT